MRCAIINLNNLLQIVEIFGKQGSCSQLILALLQQLHSSSLQVFQRGKSEVEAEVVCVCVCGGGGGGGKERERGGEGGRERKR